MRSVIVVTSHRRDEWDGGDSVITAGLFNLWPELDRCDLQFSRDIPYLETERHVRDARLIVHAGTPSWLTINNRRFWVAAELHKKPVIMLGIGLTVPYNATMWYGAEDFVRLRDTGLVRQIVCRDKLCYYWLHQRLGFPADRITVLPCPGFYLVEPAQALDKREIILSLANPDETAHETPQTFQDYFEKTAYLGDELSASGANVHLLYQRTLSDSFRDYLRRFFGERPIHTRASATELADFIRSKDVYIGVRNHGALPCAGAGKPSLLLGTDYRQHLADVVPIISRIDISHARWEPREVLDWYHALEPQSVGASLINYRRITELRWRELLNPLKELVV